MSPSKLSTRPADKGWGRGRARVAEKYLEVAGVVDDEDGAAINVCVGLAVLAGIAAGDAISQGRTPAASSRRWTYENSANAS